MIPFITNESSTGNRSLSIFIDNKMYPVDDTNPRYNELITALENEDLDLVRDIVAVKASLVKKSVGRLTFDGDTMFADGEVLNNSMIPRIISMMGQGFSIDHLMLFLDNLLDNPSKRAVDELYGFLEACSLPITDDGCFLAYKNVRANWFDIFSGTMDNSIGNVLKMPRNQVDEDSTVTCSQGLHVCSESYLPCYRQADGHTIVVKVNPRDVVAVPTDYNNAKMRVCEYTVIDEVLVDGKIDDGFVDTGVDLSSLFEDEDDDYDDMIDEVEPEPPTPTPTRTKVSKEDALAIHYQRADGWTLQAIATSHSTPDDSMSIRQVGRVLKGELHPDVKANFEKLTAE